MHLAWVASVLLDAGAFLVVGVRPLRHRNWTFGVYLFIIGYAVLLFLLCALLFPDSMLDYKGYEDFFYSRRAWFFGLLAATYLLDVVDTLIKGEEHFARFGWRISDPHAAVRRALPGRDANRRTGASTPASSPSR